MAAMPGRAEDLNPNRAVYLLPACTQFETSGSVTASNRSLQWREKVIDPLWESRSDHMIMQQFADRLGFGKELSKNYKMQKVKGMDEPVPEDILREIRRVFVIVHEPIAELIHVPPMPHDDDVERHTVAGAKRLDQRAIVGAGE
jgi:anaerobic selenocysteine-containing dehydrogenase